MPNPNPIGHILKRLKIDLFVLDWKAQTPACHKAEGWVYLLESVVPGWPLADPAALG